jgi:hypothetical protein
LNVELERFVQTDEAIRATLNRRDHVMDIRQRGVEEIIRSEHEVRRMSPYRR